MAKPPQFTQAQRCAFADAANPHSWLLTADSLHSQAVFLYEQRKYGGVLIRRGPKGSEKTWDNTNKATYLLCALALENAIKAFLVYEHPEWVSGGYLHREICSHRLVGLSGLSSLIPYQKRDRWVLEAFEEGNESWMRYPCGRRADSVDEERHLQPRLWSGYNRVMRGYGTKLIRLLGKGWQSPEGDWGKWELLGQWLGGGSPIQAGYRLPPIG